MNVNDVEEIEIEGDMLEAIFAKQKSLMDKYHVIEEKQGVGYGILKGNPFDINEIRSQCLVKDFAWRFTEEITEASEGLLNGETAHFLEELADALHFITELCIMVEITPKDLIGEFLGYNPDQDMFYKLFFVCGMPRKALPDTYKPIYHMGLAMNCLKQKPWKQTHILTDQTAFKKHIIDSYRAFCEYMSHFEDDKTMASYYFKKNVVNQFRQDTQY